MKQIVKGILVAVVAVCWSASSSAAVVTQGVIPVEIGGGPNGDGGFINAGDTEYWELDITPDSSDAFATSITTSFGIGLQLTLLQGSDLASLSTIATGVSSVSGLFTAGLTHVVQVDNPGSATSYGITVSAVPLPAAAWLFFSVILGAGWLTRKRGGLRSDGEAAMVAA